MKEVARVFVDIEVYDDYGDHTWAQAKYLVHGCCDVLWTNDLDSALEYLRRDLLRFDENMVKLFTLE